MTISGVCYNRVTAEEGERIKKTLIFKGGLGNQLFQYAKAVQEESIGNEVYVNTYWGFARDKVYKREFALGDAHYFPRTFALSWAMSKFLKKIFGFEINWLKTKQFYLEGYYQNLPETISTVTENPTKFAFLKGEEYALCSSAVLHLRIFDENFASPHNVGIVYLDKVSEKIKNLNINALTVVCENVELARSFLESYGMFEGVEIIFHTSDTPMADLKLISRFEYIFLSNSTFSLWAGIIANYINCSNACIFAPQSRDEKWAFPNLNDMPSDWELL